MQAKKLLSLIVSVFIIVYFGYKFFSLINDVRTLEPYQKNFLGMPSIKKLSLKKFSVKVLSRPSVWGLEETPGVFIKKTVTGQDIQSFVVGKKGGIFYVSKVDGSESWKFFGIIHLPDRKAIFIGPDSKLYLFGEGERIDVGLKVDIIGVDFVILKADGKKWKLSIFDLEEEKK